MRLARPLLSAAAVALVAAGSYAATAAGDPLPPAQVVDRDCGDFTSQAQAQAALLPGDPERLDADGDGVACEQAFREPEPREFEPVPLDAVEDPGSK
jgi:hypothetical protein